MRPGVDLLLVFREADPSTGGLGIDISDVARGMSARGHHVEVLTMSSGGDRPPDLGADVTVHTLRSWLPARPGVAFGLTAATSRVLRSRTPRLVHVYSCLPVQMHWSAMACALRRGVPIVWTPMLHPARQELWRTHGLAGRAMRAWDASAPRAARLTDAVCCATRAEAELFIRAGAPRVELVPPAVAGAPRVTDEQAEQFRLRLGLAGVPLVVSVIGRADRRKGLDFALATLAQLRRRVPGAVLAIVGLEHHPALEQAEGVVPLGRVSLSELRQAYRAADAVLVPSRYEAFSRVVLEAWEQARPVVVTRGVALADEVRRGGGAVVTFGDAGAAAAAIEGYLDGRPAAMAAGEFGARLVEDEYLLDAVLDRLETVYSEVSR
jgi:glycosyltransferase involved in cell wall biosynthesis